MLSIGLVFLTAFLAAGLTFYSGFGLGTLLMPVFALFFPVESAVAATAVVHGANNLFKVVLVGRLADRAVVFRFGLPAILAAFLGAAALGFASHLEPIHTYSLGSRTAVITPVKLSISCLMFLFALVELLPCFRNLQFERSHLVLGGVLSGFFGGFSGHQGALRAAFLAKSGMAPRAFVGTNAVIGFLVDLTRLSIYVVGYLLAGREGLIQAGQWPLIFAGTAAAFLGVVVAQRFLHKVTLSLIQYLTGVFLLVIALLLGAGIL